ncbi:membrane protein [Pedobacter antarcticus 4BY]|uniref:Membrane protein n=3 Tax=Pedobacter antarcticus TaxID=34086 RepID=A0A081PKN2_9SPHI|nr:membrane protein [Pedobacter antarcticus 4BY]SFE56558.1 TonB-linked outer membrane protein, SusC/RagA family [Pedobacter antarcticus]
MKYKDLLVKIMRITFLQLTILFLVFGTTLAKDTKAQAVLKTKITINEPSIYLDRLLKQLEKDYSVNFVYSPRVVDAKMKVNAFSQLRPLSELLDQLLAPLNLEYEAADDVIIISKKQSVKSIQSNIMADIAITGKVVDEKTGDPLPGVTVKMRDAGSSVVTDSNGIYKITVPNEQAILVFSYIGYKQEERAVAQSKIINVVLTLNQSNLSEVVVVGYGKQKRTTVTGAVTSANLEPFRDAPNTNIAQNLQGTVPGLNVGPVTKAGSTPQITIRGQNTINGNRNVLIILDGIQYNNSLESINPDDIESIDVLKDASSTAVYGAQAANGVILVSSRKGKNNTKPRISFSSSYTTQNPSGNLRPLNREETLEKVRKMYYTEAFLAPGYTQPNPDFNLANKVDISQRDVNGKIVDTDFNWNKAGSQKGFIQDNQLSISGGGEKVSYLISGGYTNQKGYIINDLFKRKSLRANIETQPTSWLKIGLQTFGSFVNQDGAEPGLTDLRRTSPLNSPYNADGTLKPNPYEGNNSSNPFLTYDVDDYERHNYYFANIYADANIPFIKGLNYRFNFGNNARTDNHYFASKYGAGLTGEAYKQNQQYYDYMLDNILTYSRTFNKHSINATLVYGAIERQNESTEAKANGFTRLTLGYHNLQQGTNRFTTSNAWSESLNYQMARINYAFDGKYLVTATLRRDGFSGFAKNSKYGIFPSASAGWVFTEESFLKNLPWLNFGKLRVGYGVSGNQTSRYSSLSKVSTQPAYVFGDGGTTQYGQYIDILGNPDLKWERTYELNTGLDFTLFQSRLTGSFDYYSRKTRDLLYSVDIPNITGYSKINTNIGEIANKGFELSLSSKNIDGRSFKWNTTFSFSRNVNKVMKLLGTGDLVASKLFIGQPINAVFDYRTNGIYQIGETAPVGYNTGNYRVIDLNGDGVVNTADRSILGSEDPAYRFSVLNSFQYKNFSLSIFINSIQGGHKGYLGNNSQSWMLSDNNIRWNYLSAVDFWSPGNPDGEYPMFQKAPTINPSVFRNRSFIRLQDVTLSYKIANSFTKKMEIQNLSVFASGKNLVTLTKWKGWDPEISEGGLNIDGRPLLVGYSFGLNLTF